MARRVGALLDRRNVAIAARIKSAVAARQWNIATDGRAFETGNITQRVQQLFGQTLPRGSVGILRDRQRDSAGPKLLRLEAEILLIQTNETGDEQGRASEEGRGKCNLPAD